nr:MAG TPA: hypothetical protein [Caudoviricetes sp.]
MRKCGGAATSLARGGRICRHESHPRAVRGPVNGIGGGICAL